MTLPAGALDMQMVRSELGLQGPLYMTDFQPRVLANKEGINYYMSDYRNKQCEIITVNVAVRDPGGGTLLYGFGTSPAFGSSSGTVAGSGAWACMQYSQTFNFQSLVTIAKTDYRVIQPYNVAGTPFVNSPSYVIRPPSDPNPPLDWSNFGGLNMSYATGVAPPPPWASLVGQSVKVAFYRNT